MKQLIVLSASMLILTSSLFVFAKAKMSSGLIAKEVESLASDESICYSSSDSSQNIGICRRAADASGDVCVVAHWLEGKNCYGDSH